MLPAGWGGAVVLVGVLGVVASACSSASDTAVGDDFEMSHVHGLGVNPADDELYVATHYGVFRVSDDGAERMGSLIQDTMGFTVAGEDRFLGSGHPDIRNDTILDDDMPPLLGLIESTDQAVTWDGLSLQGETDFHALAFAHDLIYGFDATGGRFMVSPDTESWETRSRPELLSFAVSPHDPDWIVAATYDAAVVLSDDGGRSWQPAPDTPDLAFVSWDADAGLWAIAADSSMHTSIDQGETWEGRGRVAGQPAALLAQAAAVYVATSEAIYSSTDQGATWTVLHEIS